MRGRNQVKNALVELKLARDVSGHRRIFYRYISDERKTRANINLLWKKMGDMVTQDLEKAIFLPQFSLASSPATEGKHRG